MRTNLIYQVYSYHTNYLLWPQTGTQKKQQERIVPGTTYDLYIDTEVANLRLYYFCTSYYSLPPVPICVYMNICIVPLFWRSEFPHTVPIIMLLFLRTSAYITYVRC